MYFTIYPLSLNIGNKIFQKGWSLSKFRNQVRRRREINKIRFKNIQTSFFTNTGAIFALIVTYVSLILALALPILQSSTNKPFNESTQNLLIGLSYLSFLKNLSPTIISKSMYLLIIFSFTIASIAYFLRKLLDHLSPEDYANLSLINLGKSELLTFVAFKNWTILNEFRKITYVNTPINLSENEKDIDVKIDSLLKDLLNFKSKQYKHIQQSIALVAKSAEKLGINKRELVNHILEFSPAIFELNLGININNLKAYKYLKKNGSSSKDYENYLNNINNYINEITNQRITYLEQILYYNEIHEYLIGMASSISTSLSFKIFLRGISETAGKSLNDIEKYDQIKAIINRSKAHCGVDLKIPYMNYSKVNNSIKLIDLDKLKPENLNALKKLRLDFDTYERISKEKIITQFEKEIQKILDHKEVAYLIIFGFSELIKNSLKNISIKLKSSNIRIFVFQEDNVKSLDTRSFRYELSRDNPISINSFTAKDSLLKNLILPKDKVIFLAGVEIFTISENLLFHTNNYQTRIEIMFEKFNIKKNNTSEMWLLGESYKFHTSLSDINNDFFNDHYNTLDLYNLSEFNNRGALKIISDIEYARNLKFL